MSLQTMAPGREPHHHSTDANQADESGHSVIVRSSRLSAFCWFAATCLALGAFVLVLIGIDQGVSLDSLAVELWLVVLAAAALIIMVALIAAALALERR